ncbi:hypothetical protein Mapa_010881 [Marchantia paleacea]|nr:hypothetical protein Mapa_010881 [Marchantia paleacea]
MSGTRRAEAGGTANTSADYITIIIFSNQFLCHHICSCHLVQRMHLPKPRCSCTARSGQQQRYQENTV